MILNVLQSNDTLEPFELDEEGFWIQFFNILNAKGRYGLSPKQISFMAWILKQENPNVCWITNPWFKILEQNFKIQRPEVSSFRKPLTDLGLLVNIRDPKKRVNTRPNPRLLKIKERFLKGEEIHMCFIMKHEKPRDNNQQDSRGTTNIESESEGI